MWKKTYLETAMKSTLCECVNKPLTDQMTFISLISEEKKLFKHLFFFLSKFNSLFFGYFFMQKKMGRKKIGGIFFFWFVLLQFRFSEF